MQRLVLEEQAQAPPENTPAPGSGEAELTSGTKWCLCTHAAQKGEGGCGAGLSGDSAQWLGVKGIGSGTLGSPVSELRVWGRTEGWALGQGFR